jgi:hypothetical protein
VKIRPDCASLPWRTAAVGIAGLAARFLLPNSRSWVLADAWQVYLAVAVVSGLLLVLAYLGWQCHRERLVASIPPEATIGLLAHLSQANGWAGSPAEFNRYASDLLYGRHFAELLTSPTDYYSALMADGFIEITSATDGGNRPDQTPDTTVAFQLTAKAHQVLNDAQSNFAVQRSGARGARPGR